MWVIKGIGLIMEGRLMVFTAFSGYDSQCMALDRLGIDYDLVGWSEIDKYAIQAHNAIYPQWSDRNYGDISKIDWNKVPDFDLFTMSSPCQDFSSAGLQRGGEEGSGTRSSLLWECRKAILAKKPKFILFENVKALVSKKFLPYFLKWKDELSSYGYSNYYKVLNAKEYGIPQNRERVFMVSILGDGWYEFPDPFALDKRLKDVLEKDVDERYYLKKTIDNLNCRNIDPQKVNKVANVNPSNHGINGNVFHVEGLSPTLTTNKGEGIKLIESKFIGYTRDKSGRVTNRHLMDTCNTIHRSTGCGGNTDCFVLEPNVLTSKRTEYGKAVRKDYESGNLKASRHDMTFFEPITDGISNTITTVQKDNLLVKPNDHLNDLCREVFPLNGDKDGLCRTLTAQYYKNGKANFERGRYMTATGATDGHRIRKLTPKECFRLMGVSDSDIDKIQAAGISKTQQYKMAGNSIVVDVLYYIFRSLFVEKRRKTGQLSLF